jgi:predicted amidohydrolase YtcJ
VPPASREERVATLRDAVEHAHSLGVTAVHAMNVGRGELTAMRALHAAGELRLRVDAFLSAERLDEWADEGVRTGDGDGTLRIGGVKMFADGALGPLTAWMLAPYEASGDTGLALQPAEELERLVRRCLEHGLSPAVHAIGDGANRVVLDIFERTAGIEPALPRRIEHAQLLHADDLPRIAALGVTASMQPIHATQDMAKVDRAWGTRGRGAYAFASLLASGARVIFGSDTPVETMDPLAGVHAAVTRRDASGEPEGGWHADERIPVEAALRAYTEEPAAAVAQRYGRIAAGCDADFVMLSDDVLEMDDAMRIATTRVELTAVGGEVVYRRDA